MDHQTRETDTDKKVKLDYLFFFGGVGLERLYKDIGDDKAEYDAIKAKLDGSL